jgi:hypothetical protein
MHYTSGMLTVTDSIRFCEREERQPQTTGALCALVSGLPDQHAKAPDFSQVGTLAAKQSVALIRPELDIWILNSQNFQQTKINREEFERWNEVLFEEISSNLNADYELALPDFNYIRSSAVGLFASLPAAVGDLEKINFVERTFDANSWWKAKEFAEFATAITNFGRLDYLSGIKEFPSFDALSRRQRIFLWGEVVRDLLYAPVQSSDYFRLRVANTLLLHSTHTPTICRGHRPGNSRYGRGARTLRQRVLSFDLMTGISPPEMTRPTRVGLLGCYFSEPGDCRAEIFPTLRAGALPDGRSQRRSIRCRTSCAIRIRSTQQGQVAHARHRFFQKPSSDKGKGSRPAALHGACPGRLLARFSLGR